MKHSLKLLLFLSWPGGLIVGQPLPDTTFQLPVTRYFEEATVYSHPHREEMLVMATVTNLVPYPYGMFFPDAYNNMPVGIQRFDSTGQLYPYHQIESKEILAAWHPGRPVTPLAFQVDPHHRYFFYFYEQRFRTIHGLMFVPGKNEELLLPHIFRLDESEDLLGMAGPTPQGVIFATVEEKSSQVNLYHIKPDQSPPTLIRRYDLSGEEFPESPFNTLYASLVLQELPGTGAPLTRKDHRLFRGNTKFYADGHQAVFTLDMSTGHTLMITMPFKETALPVVRRLGTDCKPCKGFANLEPTSVAINDYLIQIHSSTKAFGLQVYQLSDGSRIHEKVFHKRRRSREETPDLINSLGLSPVFGPPRTQPESLENGFFQARREMNLFISAISSGPDEICMYLGPSHARTKASISPETGPALILNGIDGRLESQNLKHKILLGTTMNSNTWTPSTNRAGTVTTRNLLFQEPRAMMFGSERHYFISGPYAWEVIPISPQLSFREIMAHESFELRRTATRIGE